jgi:hypothetical protein
VTYDQLSVVGPVTLANPTLNASILYDRARDSFVLIDNDGNDPVTGTFAGMAEGRLFFWRPEPSGLATRVATVMTSC